MFSLRFFFVLSVTISKPPRMMSSLANYRPFLGSFRHILPQDCFVKLANFKTIHEENGPDGRNVYLVEIAPKSLGDGRQDICKDKKCNLGPVAGY